MTDKLNSNLLGTSFNEIELVGMLNKLPVQKRRHLLSIIMKFHERINTLLYVPPTATRMKHSLHFVDLEYQNTVFKLLRTLPNKHSDSKEQDLYERVLGVIRARRRFVTYRLVNSMKMLSYKELLSQLDGISDKDVLAVYPYGSRVYGTSKPMSDYDFIIITEDITRDTEALNNHVHATFYSYEDYMIRLNDHEITMLECMSLPKEMMVKSLVHPQLEGIKLGELRASISHKSSNSLIKASKKLMLYDDRQNHYIGLKSFFHSLRIIRFGIQVAKFGKIINYSECNELYEQIMSETPDWTSLIAKYKPVHEAWVKEFQALAPKL